MRSSAKTADVTKPLDTGFEYVRFYDKGETNYKFANYDNTPVKIGGTTYQTPEHFFQCQKFDLNSDSWRAVFNAKGPDAARKQASIEHNKAENADKKKAYYASTPGFNAATKQANPYTTANDLAKSQEYKNMLAVVHARAESDPDYASMLDSSDNRYILEDTYQGPPSARNNPDIKWGGGADGMGDNLLGLALMEVRAQRKAEQDGAVFIQAQVRADLLAMREQAREDRKEMDRLAGGASNTHGKKLTDIAKLTAAAKPDPTNKSILTPTPTTPKKGRGLNFLREIKKIEAALKADGWTTKAATKPREPITMQKGSESFAIHPNKLTTESSEQDTFVAMLKAFKAANPGQEPHVTCDQADIQAKWRAAMKQVYPGITNPDIKLESDTPRTDPRP